MNQINQINDELTAIDVEIDDLNNRRVVLQRKKDRLINSHDKHIKAIMSQRYPLIADQIRKGRRLEKNSYEKPDSMRTIYVFLKRFSTNEASISLDLQDELERADASGDLLWSHGIPIYSGYHDERGTQYQFTGFNPDNTGD